MMVENNPRIPAQKQNPQHIDIKEIMNQAATSVPIDLLLARGKKNVKLLSRDKLGELINQSVTNIVRKYQYLSGKRGSITQETKQEFDELMTQYKKSMDIQQSLKQNKENMQREIAELKTHMSGGLHGLSSEQILLKRIEKLSEYAKNLENTLTTLAEQKIYSNTQINSILTELGISTRDKSYEKKMTMFKIILDENKKLQKMR